MVFTLWLKAKTNHIIRKPAGNTHPDVGLQGIFETVDGQWLALTVDSDESFKSLCHILELNKLLDDNRFIFYFDKNW